MLSQVQNSKQTKTNLCAWCHWLNAYHMLNNMFLPLKIKRKTKLDPKIPQTSSPQSSNLHHHYDNTQAQLAELMDTVLTFGWKEVSLR
jgi:hypothetical protein